jgi:SAM-dependent methyltransferase
MEKEAPWSEQPAVPEPSDREHVVVDTVCSSKFMVHQCPTLLRFVAGVHGAALIHDERDLAYCELGCGTGLTSLVLAASRPTARFHAIDMNPANIEQARKVASACGLTNIEFHDALFEQCLEHDLPQFDFITLHGVYSCIGPAARRDVHAFIDRFLKPGGICQIGYNTQAGLAPIRPLRDMMVQLGRAGGGTTLEQVTTGIRGLQALAAQKTPYLQRFPMTAEFLEGIARRRPADIAHEYFNGAWELYSFSVVAHELQDLQLNYCGSADLRANRLGGALPRPVVQAMANVDDVRSAEDLKSFLLCETQRLDVYVKGPVGSPGVPAEAAGAMLFGPAGLPDRRYESCRDGRSSIADRIRGLLTRRSRTFTDLEASNELAGIAPHEALNALATLIRDGTVRPLVQLCEGDDEVHHRRYRLIAPMVKHLVAAQLFSSPTIVVPSRVFGSGVALPFVPALFLYACETVGLEEAVRHSASIIEKSGRPWLHNGKIIEDHTSCAQLLASEFELFQLRWLPYLHRAGIVEPR